MTFPRQNQTPDRVRNAEDTLRLIATLPPPEGLADRVQARLSAAPQRSFMLDWSLTAGMNGWMYGPVLRGCAAAAIVLTVAGGGWGIYSRVQPASSASNIVEPARLGPNGGFSNAGAMRTPDTLKGPVLANPAIPAQKDVVAPVTTLQPKAVAAKPRPATHKKKAAADSVR